jgi:hypothetical protein
MTSMAHERPNKWPNLLSLLPGMDGTNQYPVEGAPWTSHLLNSFDQGVHIETIRVIVVNFEKALQNFDLSFGSRDSDMDRNQWRLHSLHHNLIGTLYHAEERMLRSSPVGGTPDSCEVISGRSLIVPPFNNRLNSSELVQLTQKTNFPNWDIFVIKLFESCNIVSRLSYSSHGG